MRTNTITADAVLCLTQESDIASPPAIERSAAWVSRQISSLAWLADSEVISVARYHDYLETEHSLLAEVAGQPTSFTLTGPLDDALSIVKVVVHQDWQHQGIGQMLLKQTIEGVQQMGYPVITLTTFREVPWNTPFYTHLGFTMSDELVPSAGLAAKEEQEIRHDLPPESRCTMCLSLRWSIRHAPRSAMAVRYKSHHTMND